MCWVLVSTTPWRKSMTKMDRVILTLGCIGMAIACLGSAFGVK